MTAAMSVRSVTAGRGLDGGCEFVEVVGLEDAGADDRESRRICVGAVVWWTALGGCRRPLRVDLDGRALDRPGQDVPAPADRLLVSVVLL
jgi:hypothetical protein